MSKRPDPPMGSEEPDAKHARRPVQRNEPYTPFLPENFAEVVEHLSLADFYTTASVQSEWRFWFQNSHFYRIAASEEWEPFLRTPIARVFDAPFTTGPTSTWDVNVALFINDETRCPSLRVSWLAALNLFLWLNNICKKFAAEGGSGSFHAMFLRPLVPPAKARLPPVPLLRFLVGVSMDAFNACVKALEPGKRVAYSKWPSIRTCFELLGTAIRERNFAAFNVIGEECLGSGIDFYGELVDTREDRAKIQKWLEPFNRVFVLETPREQRNWPLILKWNSFDRAGGLVQFPPLFTPLISVMAQHWASLPTSEDRDAFMGPDDVAQLAAHLEEHANEADVYGAIFARTLLHIILGAIDGDIRVWVPYLETGSRLFGSASHLEDLIKD